MGAKVSKPDDVVTAVPTRPGLNTVIHGDNSAINYLLVKDLKDGRFSKFYTANYTVKNEPMKAAVEICVLTSSNLDTSKWILESAERNHAAHFLRLLEHGRICCYPYLVMEVFERDLYSLQNSMPKSKFSLSTSIRLAKQCLEAVQELHEKCFHIHRGIKLNNFAVRTKGKKSVVVIMGFSKAKRYTDRLNNVIGCKGTLEWLGNQKYASLRAHREFDLGRRDDIESWLYIFMKLIAGTLPWSRLSDRQEIFRLKKSLRIAVGSILPGVCWKPFESMLKKVDSISVSSNVEYGYFIGVIDELCEANRILQDDLFDWQT